jgi:hypothetical protein
MVMAAKRLNLEPTLKFAGGKVKVNSKVKSGAQECLPYPFTANVTTNPRYTFPRECGPTRCRKIRTNTKVKSGGQECPPYTST